MMRRSSFKRPEREPKAPPPLVRARCASNVCMASALASEPARVMAKAAKPLRDPEYRRLVASLPCAYCNLQGHSQHAHQNRDKAKARKVDDRLAMPLCTVSGNSCHEAFDQYRLIQGGAEAHALLGQAMTKATHEALRALAKNDPGALEIVERVIGL